MFHIVPQLNPTIECICLLNRHFSQIPDIPASLQADMETALEKRSIPTSALSPHLDPLLRIENHVICGLSPMNGRVRALFTCSEGFWANLAWALYFMELEHIDFSELSGEALLQERRHVITLALISAPDTLKSIACLEDLIQFFETYAIPDSMKWSCILFWKQPAEYQQLFRETLQSATALFQEVAVEAQPLLDQFMPDVNALLDSGEETALAPFAAKGQNDIIAYPLVMRGQAFGILWDHTRPEAQCYIGLVGILHRHIQKLETQFHNNSGFISAGAKALGDTRRVEILKALAQKPLCNLDLASMLNLSPATVAHHLIQLLREDLVTTSRQGYRVNYSLNPDKIQLLADSIRSILP